MSGHVLQPPGRQLADGRLGGEPVGQLAELRLMRSLRDVAVARSNGERSWRKAWDSNPRKPEDFNGFRGRPIRPLWQPSVERG
jgi:hypothetical protein